MLFQFHASPLSKEKKIGTGNQSGKLIVYDLTPAKNIKYNCLKKYSVVQKTARNRVELERNCLFFPLH